MSNHSYEHETTAWIKQGLDDLDLIIAILHKYSEENSFPENSQAKNIIDILNRKRNIIKGIYRHIQNKANGITDERSQKFLDELDAERVEIEDTFRSFIAALRGEADITCEIAKAKAIYDSTIKKIKDNLSE